jgi:hypothetical protein
MASKESKPAAVAKLLSGLHAPKPFIGSKKALPHLSWGKVPPSRRHGAMPACLASICGQAGGATPETGTMAKSNRRCASRPHGNSLPNSATGASSARRWHDTERRLVLCLASMKPYRRRKPPASAASGIPLHAQACQLVKHGRDRNRRAPRSMPRPSHW